MSDKGEKVNRALLSVYQHARQLAAGQTTLPLGFSATYCWLKREEQRLEEKAMTKPGQAAVLRAEADAIRDMLSQAERIAAGGAE